LAQTGHTGDDLDDTLLSWMGVENYEERHVPGSIDPLVLDKLRQSAGKATGQAAGREADPPGTGR
ncbi:MAG: fimbrial assembly protein FimA, partial [Actinomycetota bacterium]|nr:fimbrial assembly protein FimA [Actinomycetota bacterium]